MVAVGRGSYLRVMPLLLMGRGTASARVERTIRQGSAAALTALAVSSLQHGAGSGPLLAFFGATAAGLVVALRGASMLRVVALGGATYAALVTVGALIP
jgi:branched-subunit amino acid transport protein